jgi:hypothetical protein
MARARENHSDLPGWPLMLPAALAARYVSLEPEGFRRAVGKGEISGPRRLDGQLRWARPELDDWIVGGTGSGPSESEDRLLADIATKESATSRRRPRSPIGLSAH